MRKITFPIPLGRGSPGLNCLPCVIVNLFGRGFSGLGDFAPRLSCLAFRGFRSESTEPGYPYLNNISISIKLVQHEHTLVQFSMETGPSNVVVNGAWLLQLLSMYIHVTVSQTNCALSFFHERLCYLSMI